MKGKGNGEVKVIAIKGKVNSDMKVKVIERKRY
jgi:hypothetical protein